MSPLDFDPDAILWDEYDAYREVIAHPAQFDEARFSLDTLWHVARRSQFLFRGWPFIFFDDRFTKRYNNRVETVVDVTGLRPYAHFERWELHQSGLFLHKELMDEETYEPARSQGKIIGFEMTVYHISEAIGSLWRLYGALGMPEDETLSIEFRYTDAKGRRVQVLDFGRGHIRGDQECMEEVVERRRLAPLSIWRATDADIAAEIAAEVFHRFGWISADKDVIRKITSDFLAKPRFGTA